MNHILAAVDFGPASTAVCEHAAEIAVRSGAKLTLLHVYQLVAGDTIQPMFFLGLRGAERKLQEYAAPLRERHGKSLDLELEIVESSSSGGILGYANRVDLTVIGQTGRHGLYRFFLGDVTGRVLDGAHGPVLVVPATQPMLLPRHIVFAADERLPTGEAFEPLRELLGAVGAELEVYHVLGKSSQGHGPELERLVGDMPYTYHAESREEGNLASFIGARAGRGDSAWLCLAHRQRAPIAQALLRSLSERVAADALVPVLVLADASDVKRPKRPAMQRPGVIR